MVRFKGNKKDIGLARRGIGLEAVLRVIENMWVDGEVFTGIFDCGEIICEDEEVLGIKKDEVFMSKENRTYSLEVQNQAHSML